MLKIKRQFWGICLEFCGCRDKASIKKGSRISGSPLPLAVVHPFCTPQINNEESLSLN